MRRWLWALAMLAPLGLPAEEADQAPPLEIRADRAEIDHLQHVALFQGHVVLRRGAFELRCPRLRAYFREEQGRLRLVRAKATGGVQFRDRKAHGNAKQAELDLGSQKLVLLGDARIEREGGLIEGERIEHDLAKQRTKVAPKEGTKVRVWIEEQ